MPGDALLEAAGSLRQAYAQVDWAATPIGHPSSWSPALRNAVDLALGTQFPVTLFWGPEFVLVYNAAYVPLIGDKHPAALGAPAREVFPEAWDAIGPLMEGVLAGQGATWVEDELVPLERRGFLEETYFTFSYSPVRGADGTIEGVMDIAAETTRQVVDRRRLQTLGRLREALSDAEHGMVVPARALAVLREDTADLIEVELHIAGERPPARILPGERPIVVQPTAAGTVAWLALGPRQEDGRQSVLMARLSDMLAPDAAYFEFLRLLAATIGQALDRVTAREIERGIAAAERSMSEAMQRSLLTRPPRLERQQIAVRYLPASRLAQVGGDWHDAFTTPDGLLTLVIGDVAGHDRLAAAAMAQVRNLLRGVSFTLSEPPAAVLTALDRAMHRFDASIYATAVLAQLDLADPGTLRWSNAGHPPPVLLAPDGTPRLLETPPDVLLGLGQGQRADHAVALQPGATLVLYTDGLVERRDVPLDRRLDWLLDLLAGRQDLDPEALCDHLVAQLDGAGDDDVALLVLRAGG